jgi:dipeptidyl aminopeptidase/acylaminoacyl peptidase
MLIFLWCLNGCAQDSSAKREVIQFQNESISFEGELSIPGGQSTYPLAIFIHGSGRTTRDDYIEFVSVLDSAGIASFRYDKRGVGASGGEYSDVGPHNAEKVFSLLASDAAAAIRHLKNDKRISDDKIILIGGSQAGWIIAELNSILTPFLSVCISGPTVTVGEEIFYSDLIEKDGFNQTEADVLLQEFKGPYGYNPIHAIQKMKSPSLWIFGEKDVSIPVKKSIHILDSLKTSLVLPVKLKIYAQADHGLYNRSANMREPYVKLIIDWIRQQL